MELVYKLDKNGQEMLCNEDETHQIMMEWEKPYMEKSIEVLNPFGKVLEIGFGIGYSATKICSYEAVEEYNVIECSPIVWEKFEEFKNKQLILRPNLVINLIKGRWEDVLKTTEIFDCIYFDDYVLDKNKMLLTNDRGTEFLHKVLKNHTKIGSKMSLYSGVDCSYIYKNINCINVECLEYKIDIPDNCLYVKGDKMYIPIITKISEIDNDFNEKILKNKKEAIEVKNNNFRKEIQKEMDKQTKYKKLFEDIKTRKPNCGLIVIDNFYENPYETRNYILTQEFMVRGNYPGQRTISYANQHLKDIIQEYISPFGGKILDFPMPDESNINNNSIYNGAFQYTTSRDRSWVHIDGFNNWAGVLYMTPNAPLSSGTAFYKFHDGTTCEKDMQILDNKIDTDNYSQDMTKWELVDRVGNVFNRLILFNSKRFHMSMDYFGNSKENGRLFQVFFFSTER
jgi:predicted O-methyltransferase YrrM